MRNIAMKDDLNSPENLLGKWLKNMSEFFSTHGIENGYGYDANCSALLAHILIFANKHGKILEMFRWLISSDGSEFLDREEYQHAGNMVAIKIHVVGDFLEDLDLDTDDKSEEQLLIKKLTEWAYENDDYCQFSLELKR
jgi:hypothetical protein